MLWFKILLQKIFFFFGPKIKFQSLHYENSSLNFKFKCVETRGTTFVSLTPTNFPSTQNRFKNMPGTGQEQIHVLETLYVVTSTLTPSIQLQATN